MAITNTSKFRPLPVTSLDLLAARGRCRQLEYRPAEDAAKKDAAERYNSILEAIENGIDAALQAVNGKATAFTIADSQQVRTYANQAERLLENAGIPESERPGTIVTVRPAGPSVNAYKHSAVSTRITMRRQPKGAWTLTNVERCDVWPKQGPVFMVQISAAAAECARKAVLRPFDVRPAGVPELRPAAE